MLAMLVSRRVCCFFPYCQKWSDPPESDPPGARAARLGAMIVAHGLQTETESRAKLELVKMA